MLISLFGGVGVTDDQGVAIDVGPPKCEVLLAALALSAGTAVPVGRLVEMVWADRAPRTAEKTLQSYVTRLRKSLGAESVVRRGVAYRLDVEPEAVDVLRFRSRLGAGDVKGALAEWTGVPLAGVEAPGLSAVVDGLVEQWLGAVELDFEELVEADPGAAIGPLTELTAGHPFREGLWATLMTALYRVGRQADALAAYRRARELLVGELGVEPGPRLRGLESRILGQDDQLKAAQSSRAVVGGAPSGTVTFGFCDIEGSVRLWATVRSRMAPLMDRYEELVRAAAGDQRGYVFSAGGDSFGVAFHRVSDALRWATELQSSVGAEPWPGGVELRVRIGLHTGEAEERGNDYFGTAVNLAAGIAAAGHGGQTLVSGPTAALAEDFELRRLGTHRLDDVLGEHRLYQLGDGSHPPLRIVATRTGNLPRRTGRLIGRETDLDLVVDAMATGSIVTLLGPGGIGKTRLATTAAAMVEIESPGDVWLVELAHVASSADVCRTLADTLGIDDSGAVGLADSITAFLRNRHDLIVLDNCEHVVDGAAEIVQTIVESCPGVRVLATSREGLGVVDERLIVVGPLDPAGAGVALFNERASAASRTFDPAAARADVVEICRRLDGVPLAIELAAARVTRFSLPEILERLEDHLRLLTGGRRTSVERHRTMRATIQWSYDLLTPVEQSLFQRLAIFTGPFDLGAVESVVTDDEHARVDVDDLLGGLIDRSMITIEPGRFGPRFRLLETMRQFAAEELSGSGEADLVAERHARWCLSQVLDVQRLLKGRRESEGVVRLGELWSNLRAAVAWAIAEGDHGLAFALVRPVAPEISLRSQHEIADWFERILSITPTGDADAVAFCLTFCIYRQMLSPEGAEAYQRLAAEHGEPDHPLVRHARAIFHGDDEVVIADSPALIAAIREEGEEHLADFLEVGVLSALLSLGRFDELDRLSATMAERFRRHGPPTLLQWSLFMGAYSAAMQGDRERADRLFDESVTVDVPAGSLSLNAPMESRAALRRGDASQAVRILRDHLSELVDLEVPVVARLACVPFVEIMTAHERFTDAAPILRHLETSAGNLGALSARTLIADSAGRIAAGSKGEALTVVSDGPAAVEHMIDALDRLAGELAAG